MGYLDHIDPGNSGGSVPTPGTVFVEHIKPIVYPCKICSSVFRKHDELADHITSEHPIKLPILLINGQPVRKKNITIRSSIPEHCISFQDVDNIYVDDIKACSRKELITRLCSHSPIAFELKIANGNHKSRYLWTIEIASLTELDNVDKLFYSAFQSSLEIYQAFSLFKKQVAGVSPAAKHYAAGLGCYVMAIITKDQLPEATLEFNQYTQKLGESMDILDDYRGRSLTESIFSIAQFMQNDFQLQSHDTNLPALFSAKQFFSCGQYALNKNSKKSPQSIPIDTVTNSLVDFSSGSTAFQKTNISSIEVLMKSTKTDARDRAKSAFAAWSHYSIVGDHKKAAELRGKLSHNQYFGSLVCAVEGFHNE
jgi:hypothetical protein